jgi:hypothetical protein
MRNLICCVVLPVTLLAAPAFAQAEGESDPKLSLQTPRLDIALFSFEAPALTATAAYLFVLASREARAECSTFCIYNPAGIAAGFAITGLVSLAISAWSLRLLVRSVRMLRSRKGNAVDDDSSVRLNRRVIAYDAFMTMAYTGSALGSSLSAAHGETLAEVTGAIAGASVALLALHVWSLVRNVRELKRAKRQGFDPPRRPRRVRISGNGFGW